MNSHGFKLHRFYSVSFDLSNVGEIIWSWIRKNGIKVQKKKKKICVFCSYIHTYIHTYSLKWAREIRKFHVAIVQRRLRNVQKEWCTWKFVVLLISTYFFAVFVALAVAKALYCFDPKISLPWQRDVTLLLSIRVHLRDGPTGEDRTVCNNRERADHVNEFYFTFSCPLPVSFKLPDFFFKNISLVHQFVSSDNTQNTSLN